MRWIGGLFAAGILGIVAGLGPKPEATSLWYKCPTGATLEVMGPGSRCTFASVVVPEPMEDCGLGWWVVVDGASRPAGADACSNGKQTAQRTCAAKLVVVRDGLDRCERVTTRRAEPATIAVQVGSRAIRRRPVATYWQCPAGFNLELNGVTLVRCRKPSSDEHAEQIDHPRIPIQL